MKRINLLIVFGFIISIFFYNNLNAQKHMKTENQLNLKQQKIVTISAFTAKGNLKQLKKELNEGLDSGLTINEIKEVLAHLYAYCGFPRSLRGVNTFMDVIKERESKGIKDETGKEVSPVNDNISKYKRGEKTQMTVTGQTAEQLKSGFAEFSPIMDVFLKEHLFADIFDRDILSYIDREIVTVSALISIEGVEPMIQSHLNGALNVGGSESQLKHLISIIEIKISEKEANISKEILNKVITSRIK